MISRRNFIQALGVGGVYVSMGASLAHAVYKKASIYLTDFSGIISTPIRGFVTDNEKAQSLIKNGGTVHPRGTGHSHMGKSMKKNAMIFTPEETELVFKNGIVYASAGTTLLDIDNYLEQYGQMLPASPDHRALSLGGVLSVGGYGVEACRYGALVDHVVSMDVMAKDGQILKNLSGDDPVVKKILCSIGQHGVILSAGIRCIPKPITSFIGLEVIPDVDFYVQEVKKFIEASKEGQTTDIWYAIWSKYANIMSRGRAVYDEKSSLTKEAGYRDIKDYRAYRKAETDMWVFLRPYQYNIWSDHMFTIDNLKPALEKALVLMNEAQAAGGEAVIYSTITKTNDTMEHSAHYDTDNEYLISIGIFVNFLEADKELAKDVARKQMLYSKYVQEEWDANVYRYAWEWKDNFEI